MFEDIHTEFKNLFSLDINMIVNYISGFLNSYDGTIYFGISDDGIIRGTSLTRKDIDEFLLGLDHMLRKCRPRIFPDQVNVTFHEISKDLSYKYVIVDLYVVEINIYCTNNDDHYLTNEGMFYLKKHA